MNNKIWLGIAAFFVTILLSSSVSAVLDDATLYYSFDDADRSGSTIIDSAGNYNGTNTGASQGIDNSSCVLEQCGYYDGNDDFVDTGTQTLDTSDGSISFWFRAWDYGGNRFMVTDRGASGEYISFAALAGGTLQFRMADGANYDVNSNTSFSEGELVHAVVTWGSGGIKLYQNGLLVGTNAHTGAWTAVNNLWVGKQNAFDPDFDHKGFLDEFGAWNRQLTLGEVQDLYNSGSGYNPYTPAPSIPYASIRVFDLYDNASLQGLTVWVGDSSNTTEASGIATIYNPSGTNYTIVGGTNYFDKNGTATENATVQDSIIGAQVGFNATNLLGTYLENFTVYPPETDRVNSSTGGYLTIVLKPNSTLSLTVAVFDGNDTEQTYVNNTINYTSSSKDNSDNTLADIYQALLKVNVSIGTTSTQISNFTSNITGLVNDSQITTAFETSHEVMNGNISIIVAPAGYSLSYLNITVDLYNFTPYVVVPAFTLNSFYLSLLDEITANTITESMSIELISDATAGVYNTSNGSIALELLTPAAYTIRYKSLTGTNYTERDYYQDLVNNNYYDLNLYAILNSESTDMLVTVKDTGGDPVEDATVKLLRYYPSCNCYSVVEMAKTSYAGEAFFYVDAYDGHYKFAVDYEGTNYFLSTSPENLVPTISNLVTRSIVINLGDAYFQSYRNLENVGRTLTYSNETNALVFTWSDAGGLVTQGCLYASYLDGIHYTAVTPACSNGSTGSVVLSLNTSQTSYKYYAEVDTSTTYSSYTLFSGTLDKLPLSLFDGADYRFGAFMAGSITIGLALMFSYSAIAVLIITSIGMIFMSVLGLAPLQTTFVTGFATIVIGMGAYLMRS